MGGHEHPLVAGDVVAAKRGELLDERVHKSDRRDPAGKQALNAGPTGTSQRTVGQPVPSVSFDTARLDPLSSRPVVHAGAYTANRWRMT
jgi:hypothetical protein